MSVDQFTTNVEYREIPRFVGYRFGDDGSIWSCWTRVKSPDRGVGFTYVMTDRWTRLRGRPDINGYVMVNPKDADLGRCKPVRLHHLILEAFVGPRPDGMEARHFPDRDRTNNSVENLHWGTPKQNAADRKVHGTDAIGSKHGMHKLTDEQVAEIRERFAVGAASSQLGSIYGVCKETIAKLAYGHTWKNPPGHPPIALPNIRRPGAKLIRPQVEEIRRLRVTGMTYAAIAELFGVTRCTISDICLGKSWFDVPPVSPPHAT
jgi:hypothetical protein